MALINTDVSDKELEYLYNSLEKGSLVKLLIEKRRELEKQIKGLSFSEIEELNKNMIYQITGKEVDNTNVSNAEIQIGSYYLNYVNKRGVI